MAAAAVLTTVPVATPGKALPRRMLAIGFEMAIEPPDQRARSALGHTLRIGEGIELVNEALGMDPAQAVRADVELSGERGSERARSR